MSETGKRITTVISCTTMETVRVSDPALFYEADRLHIIYMAEKGPKKEYYESVVDEIESTVNKKRDVKVIRHNSTVYRFSVMLRLINDIIKHEKDEFGEFVDTYVNISSGTSEYAAAAMCASMMNKGCIPFSVAVKEHTILFDKFLEMASVDGHPVGDALTVHNPRMIETFNFEPPDEDLVRYLLFFDSLRGRPYTTGNIIRLMDANGIWRYQPTKTKDPGKNAASVQYNRVVLTPLIEKGWLRNGSSKNRWIVTPSGRAILDIFTDEEDRIPIIDLIEDYTEKRCCMSMAFSEPEDRNE